MASVIRFLVWILVLGGIALGMSLWVARPAVAAACPACFGFSRVQDGLYVQSAMQPAQRQQAVAVVAAAEQRIVAFYGQERFPPRVLVCADDACYGRIGGMPGSGTGAVASDALVVAPAAVNTVAVAEALSHIEMRGRVGLWKMQMGAVPRWFEEGLAVVVSEDPLYLGPAKRANRCLAGVLTDMPATPEDWRDALQQQGDLLYAQSACKTWTWAQSHGGGAGVSALLDKLAAGQDFAALTRAALP